MNETEFFFFFFESDQTEVGHLQVDGGQEEKSGDVDEKFEDSGVPD